MERVRIILACATGKENQEIAAEFGMFVPPVSKWHQRFAVRGIEGLKMNNCLKSQWYMDRHLVANCYPNK